MVVVNIHINMLIGAHQAQDWSPGQRVLAVHIVSWQGYSLNCDSSAWVTMYRADNGLPYYK